jgi:predicted AlkP superfamily phosphohydrolase/phosphomutase
MGKGPQVAVILLDGTDPESISRQIEAGWLPVLAKSFREARTVDLQALNELFPTALWPCVASGVAVENHGIHNFRPIKSGTLRIVEPTERPLPTPPFWETAVRAGLSASIIDVPIYGPPPPNASLDGLRYLEWGAHPAIRPAGSFPPSLVSEIQLRHHAHPFRDDDSSLRTVEELTAAQVRICEGVRARERIILDMLDQGPPDLLVACFAEAHIGGHQFLNLTTDRHPHYDPAVVAELGELPLRTVYEAIDAAVGHILDRLPADTTVLVACMCGLRVSHGSSSLLDDVLQRVGLTARAPSRLEPLRRLWRRLPAGLRRAGAKRLTGAFSRAKEAAFFASFDWAATRAFALPWTYDGYLRVNQRGRERFGVVGEGAEREQLLDEIETLLGELRIAGTDKLAVRQIVRTQDSYVGQASAELPDLMVLWHDDERLDAIESARVGRIDNRDIGIRGAHTNRGVIFAWGPAVAPGPALEGARDIDVAPTVLALLGIDPPNELDGHVIAGLVRATG